MQVGTSYNNGSLWHNCEDNLYGLCYAGPLNVFPSPDSRKAF